MKLATYCDAGRNKLGAVHHNDSRIFDLSAAAARKGESVAPFASMLSLIDAGDAALDQARNLLVQFGGDVDLSILLKDAEILAPLPVPRQMRDGMSFPLHILQAPLGMRKYLARQRGDDAEVRRLTNEPLGELPAIYRKMPIYYITNRFSVRGTGTTVEWPDYSRIMDYELEFGIVTKGKGANIKTSDAGGHIFGFTVFNDFSARDMQGQEMEGYMGPAKGKSFDGGNVLGPWIVTPDEIGDPYALDMEARVNGETWSRGRTQGMLFSFEEIIAHVSRSKTLMPGEFIGSGTVGNGCGLEIGKFLNDGDTVELTVERIGTLTNKVASSASKAENATKERLS